MKKTYDKTDKIPALEAQLAALNHQIRELEQAAAELGQPQPNAEQEARRLEAALREAGDQLARLAAAPRHRMEQRAELEREVQRRRELYRIHDALTARRKRAAAALTAAQLERAELAEQVAQLEKQAEKLLKKAAGAARTMDETGLALGKLGPLPLVSGLERRLAQLEREGAEETQRGFEQQRALRQQMHQLYAQLRQQEQELGNVPMRAYLTARMDKLCRQREMAEETIRSLEAEQRRENHGATGNHAVF